MRVSITQLRSRSVSAIARVAPTLRRSGRDVLVIAFASAVSVLGIGLGAAAPACRALEPTNRPVDTCVKSCKIHASRSCSEAECERGCEFIIDRILEKEGDNVVACVGRTPRRCTDVVWADCASRIGVHADGGPPGPVPPQEDD